MEKPEPMRVPQWERRLHDLVLANRARRHEYGRWDCLLLSAAVIEAMTGVDHARGHRGKYRSAASAVRYLNGLGFADPAAMLDSLLEQKPVGYAGRGDLVLVPGNAGGWDIPALCIGADALVIGESLATATDASGTDAGFKRVPRAQWLKAWKVG